MKKIKKLAAFTLAEVLITLAIIGVVAALTIPTVITNYQKKMYVTQLKKTYNNIIDGFHVYMARAGVPKLSDTALWSKIPSGYPTAQSDYMNKGEFSDFRKEFEKIFKVAAMYGPDNLPKKYKIEYKTLDGTIQESFDSGTYLADGTFLWFNIHKDANTNKCGTNVCSSLKEFQETKNTKTKLYSGVAEFLIDVNGIKGPNILGRDIFDFELGNDGMLYPVGGADYAVWVNCEYDNLDSCYYYWTNKGAGSYACYKGYYGNGCAGRIIEEGWEMKY